MIIIIIGPEALCVCVVRPYVRACVCARAEPFILRPACRRLLVSWACYNGFASRICARACVCFCALAWHTASRVETTEPVVVSFRGRFVWAQETRAGLHIGATWRMRMNVPCAAAIRTGLHTFGGHHNLKTIFLVYLSNIKWTRNEIWVGVVSNSVAHL